MSPMIIPECHSGAITNSTSGNSSIDGVKSQNILPREGAHLSCSMGYPYSDNILTKSDYIMGYLISCKICVAASAIRHHSVALGSGHLGHP